MMEGDERRESQIENLKGKETNCVQPAIRRSSCNFFFFLRTGEEEKRTPDAFTSRVAHHPFVALIPVNSDVIYCHAM